MENLETMKPLLEVENLHKSFSLEAGLFAKVDQKVYAVNGVSFSVRSGEIFGIVGESGSGKSTTARCIVHAHPPTSGRIVLDGAEITPKNLPRIRTRIKYVFQDPSSSLDPRMTVEKILTLGRLRSPEKPSKAAVLEEAREMIRVVGLGVEDLKRRPGDFSGGQRQRISLARALMGRPEILICDEVVSALDVSIQGQILNLLLDLKEEFKLTILFIAHNLNVVGYLCDRVAVMYGGRIVEQGPVSQVLGDPRHPYTQMLAESSPVLGRPLAPNLGLSAAASTYQTTQMPQGCPYVNRCPLALTRESQNPGVLERCRTQEPALRELSPSLQVACHEL